MRYWVFEGLVFNRKNVIFFGYLIVYIFVLWVVGIDYGIGYSTSVCVVINCIKIGCVFGENFFLDIGLDF